jgi:hypothetical protein
VRRLAGDGRPQVELVLADQVREQPPVAALRDPAADPSLDGLEIDAQRGGDLRLVEPGVRECATQRVVDRSS